MTTQDGATFIREVPRQEMVDVVGALPPAAAHDSKYHVSQSRGLIFQSFNVSKMENIIIARRPAHSAPEP